MEAMNDIKREKEKRRKDVEKDRRRRTTIKQNNEDQDYPPIYEDEMGNDPSAKKDDKFKILPIEKMKYNLLKLNEYVLEWTHLIDKNNYLMTIKGSEDQKTASLIEDLLEYAMKNW